MGMRSLKEGGEGPWGYTRKKFLKGDRKRTDTSYVS